MKGRLRTVFETRDTETSRKLARGIADEYAENAPKAVETQERGFDDATAVLALPEY